MTNSETNQPSSWDKWRYSLYSAIIFLLISLPITYKITNSIGLRTLRKAGCPSWIGIFVHTVVFLLLIRLAMHLP